MISKIPNSFMGANIHLDTSTLSCNTAFLRFCHHVDIISVMHILFADRTCHEKNGGKEAR